ncbi:MAG: hypothetical protein KDC38_17290 [Planctomycetes bacterium]|nr:hypothetical protein [Planctomycetota bacterium]
MTETRLPGRVLVLMFAVPTVIIATVASESIIPAAIFAIIILSFEAMGRFPSAIFAGVMTFLVAIVHGCRPLDYPVGSSVCDPAYGLFFLLTYPPCILIAGALVVRAAVRRRFLESIIGAVLTLGSFPAWRWLDSTIFQARDLYSK